MMLRITAIATTALTLAACAPQAPLVKQTSSGYPEELMRSATTDRVKSLIMETCMTRGSIVQDSGPNHVVCGKTMTGNDAALAQLVLGNSYSTTPEQKARFTFVQTGENVLVTVQQWFETQMAFGQIRKAEQNSNNHRNSMQSVLASIANQAYTPKAATPSPPVAAASAP